ncbi:hypothetical protein ASPZODRAFT_78107 [Penicilliopsis zonata CBS 506.65]|uniref:Uncharacterized protein n=1 Tax=Penicilliopsis zonata CBS 506.65 TaxID=1073090 RepID=A0A1L9S4A1_9EURO|nr:hypothetical protein ASPZODRAFT_78107 [Penicilliopsis zonata CBS 506.65]OJJ41992.1 hypothetical protein ASPZODRAFT_78107 [Penicilliopsis zonata CBS 506.65]
MEEGPNGHGTPKTSSEALTVDQMLQRYSKKNVERAIFHRDYVSERTRLIEEYNIMITTGHNVEVATRARDTFIEDTPSQPPIDPDEPADLDPDVLWRIKILKYMYRDSPVIRPDSILDIDAMSVDPDTIVNRDAILNAYRHGNLKVVFGEVSVWFAGNLVVGPVQNSKLDQDHIIDKVPEWKEKYGPGRVWQERVCFP